MIPFPTDEWIKDLSRRLNESDSYERSAKDWEGDFVFIVEPDGSYPETTYLFLSLYHGKSPGAQLISGREDVSSEFVMSAPFGTWRRVIEGKLDPIQGMMTRQLRVEGNMMKIMRYPKAAKEIVDCCANIPTRFPDEAGR
jgi:putative sterol carrier protein